MSCVESVVPPVWLRTRRGLTALILPGPFMGLIGFAGEVDVSRDIAGEVDRLALELELE